MCGFCGILGPSRRAFAEDVEPMAKRLHHRGPDDFGVWSSRFADARGEMAVALGHTRLSILDLSPLGHQPMTSQDGALTIAYNGEIYNFLELREELEGLGASFRSRSDTEVLLEAYRAWGVKAFERLIGMFAFALWDAERRQLVLVRDRLGIKPLYYRLEDDVLTFGSELGALRCHRGFRPTLDRVALGRYLRLGYVCGEETIYAGTRRLLPGHYAVWEDGRLRTSRYWRLSEPDADPPPASFGEAVDALEALLGDAVQRRLVSDVPLGAFLSGGIDSSVVVALMQERADRPVRTFSIGFREAEYDEAPFARRMAEHLGTDHTELYVDRADAVGVAHEIADLYDEPFADSSAIPTTLLSRLTRDHVTVALSGDGGDELFGGYERYAKLRRLLPLFRLPRPLRGLLGGLAPWAPVSSLRNGLEHLRARDALELLDRMTSHFDPAAVGLACGAPADRLGPVFERAWQEADTPETVRRAMAVDAQTYLPDDILTKVDRASMSVALEARVPILDHRVVRFAFSLPTPLLWHGGRTKAPLREILHRRVPAALFERPKHGFGIPLETLLQRELRAWTDRYLDPRRLAEEGNLDPHGVARLLEQTRGSDALAAARTWFLVCFQRWYARTHLGERDA